jgi:hypothetical protein
MQIADRLSSPPMISSRAGRKLCSLRFLLRVECIENGWQMGQIELLPAEGGESRFKPSVRLA